MLDIALRTARLSPESEGTSGRRRRLPAFPCLDLLNVLLKSGQNRERKLEQSTINRSNCPPLLDEFGNTHSGEPPPRGWADAQNLSGYEGQRGRLGKRRRGKRNSPEFENLLSNASSSPERRKVSRSRWVERTCAPRPNEYPYLVFRTRARAISAWTSRR